MSGGSHGYIGRVYDMWDLLEKLGELPDVAQRLRDLGHGDAARATQALYDRLLDAPPEFEALVKVWGAVDFLDSNDKGPDDVAKAVSTWRAKKQ